MTEIRPEAVDAYRANRFVLALADSDNDKIVQLLDEINADPRPAAQFLFELQLAGIVIDLAEQLIGPEWRSVFGARLLDLEVEHFPGQADG